MSERIIIEVNGGVVQAVYTDADLEVILVDYDNIAQGDDADHLTTTPWDDMDAQTYKHFQNLIDANLRPL